MLAVVAAFAVFTVCAMIAMIGMMVMIAVFALTTVGMMASSNGAVSTRAAVMLSYRTGSSVVIATTFPAQVLLCREDFLHLLMEIQLRYCNLTLEFDDLIDLMLSIFPRNFPA